MAPPMTEPLDPYESDHSSGYDWDEEPATDDPPRILWGRVAVLGAMLLLAFLLGRATKSAGVPDEELSAARQHVQELQAENKTLEEELASAPVVTDQPAAGTETGSEEGGETGTTDTSGKDKTYIVEEGDSLTTIAQKFYGDPSLDDFLAEVNGITDPTQLAVGQELTIPNDPPG